jgi:prepilin-type N-terminal cleavage/methylation domain-containing protein
MTRQAGHVRGRRGGFTLVEVLVTMLLIAIVVPSIMAGIAQSTHAATLARARNEVAGLAQAELAQIVASQQWQNGNLQGDFGADWPGYSWQAVVQPWPLDTTTQSVQEIDLKVTWIDRNRENSMTVSTLAYVKGQASSTSTSTSTSTQ